ncbi:MAG: hypothetical protein COB12_07415 [Flavobacterium sp.]|nr:MAG: hypothetical protein COB12_07415 [Flavobacterium sp.]
MKNIKLFLPILLLSLFISCNKDDGSSNEDEEESQNPELIIINNGNGGVNSINDTGDTEPLLIVQAVPSTSSDYPAKMPIILFFNDKVFIDSIEDNFKITEDGEEIGGTISINEGANGFAIFTFSPKNPFQINAEIVLEITGNLQDDGGNFLSSDFNLIYTTVTANNGDFNSNGGFENGNEGVLFIGDGAILSGNQGCVDPYVGSSFAAITSGTQLVSNGSAIGGASSNMLLGPINSDISSITFHYDFLSAEFQEFVDSEFDDSVIVTLVGSNGSHSEFLTSVNTIGIDGNTQCNGFPNMPDDGDSYVGTTGWIEKTMNFSSLEEPVFIIFTITDVADTAYSSIVTIDHLLFE